MHHVAVTLRLTPDHLARLRKHGVLRIRTVDDLGNPTVVEVQLG